LESSQKNKLEKKRHTKLKIFLGTVVIVVILTFVSLPFALQERQANPAEVNPTSLNELGWSGIGTVDRSSYDLKYIVTLRINVAALNYIDNQLAGQVNIEKNRIVDMYKAQHPELPGSIATPDIALPQVSRLATLRTMPPMISDFFGDQLVNMVTDQLISQGESIMKQWGVRNVRKVGQIQLTVRAKSVAASVYEGDLTAELGGKLVTIHLKGILAAWYENGIVMAAGVVPSGTLKYDYVMGSVTIPLSFDFEKTGAGGGSEFNELLKLVEGIS
jgi:hypothetical protein